MRFIAWIRLKPMAWVSDYSWFDGQRICSAIASGSDPQSGTDHVFRSWPEQDGQKIGVPNYPKVDRRLRRSGNEQNICHL
jgi:hypothetical protein